MHTQNNKTSSSDSTSLNHAADEYFSNPNEISKTRVVDSARGIIYKFARLYGGGICMDDLYQTGCEALIKALDTYDGTKGASFVTYASHCIIGAIRHYVRKENAYYYPGSLEKLQKKVYELVEENIEKGEIPHPEYIAKKVNVRTEGLDEIMKAGLVSFDEINTDAIQSIQYETFHLPVEDKLFLECAMKKLDNLQKQVINLFFFKGMTQNEVAQKLGISQRQVSRIKDKSIEKMRDAESPIRKAK